MMAGPARLKITRKDLGLGLGKLKSGIMCEVYREEFSVEIGDQILYAKIEVPRHKGAVDFKKTRQQEALTAWNVMAMKVSQATGKIFAVKVEGEQGYLEESAMPEVTPLTGVELILVRALVYMVHAQHPKWTRAQVSEAVTKARMGEGIYAGEWARMNSRGPSQADADDAAAV